MLHHTSPATCGRGLKQTERKDTRSPITVARHVRAWIETSGGPSKYLTAIVARHVRAWIETGGGCGGPRSCRVARHVRAWIETRRLMVRVSVGVCRPPRAGVD